MLAATLLAAVFQLGWPIALAMHQHLEHSHAVVDDPQDPHASNHSGDPHHSHDSSDCPTCQSIAQLRAVHLPSPSAIVSFALTQQPASAPTPQAPAAYPLHLDAAPRAPPLV
jgi:hypothetical protein